MKRSLKRSVLSGLMALAAGSAVFQVGGCGALQYLARVNPCGPVLACLPAQYEFARSGLDGTNFDANIDPFCSLPPFCGPADDPIFGTVLGGP